MVSGRQDTLRTGLALLLVTSASLLVTSALLVVTMFAIRNNKDATRSLWLFAVALCHG